MHGIAFKRFQNKHTFKYILMTGRNTQTARRPRPRAPLDHQTRQHHHQRRRARRHDHEPPAAGPGGADHRGRVAGQLGAFRGAGARVFGDGGGGQTG